MDKVKLFLSDIIEKTGIDIKRIKLIRHSKSDDVFNECQDKDMVKEYTAVQKTGFSKNHDHWMVFISGKGTTAILDSFYKVNGSKPFSIEDVPQEYPMPEKSETRSFFDLEKLDILKNFENRLIIDWGKGTIGWHHNATTDKEIIGFHAVKKYEFEGYEKIICTFGELEEIINEPSLYSDWHTALSAVKGIYLITDKTDGRKYVGSAYNDKGILGRWTEYIETKHGNNVKLMELLDKDPKRYKSFQFSILQVLPKAITDDEVILIENRYKDKLLTRDFGLNDN